MIGIDPTGLTAGPVYRAKILREIADQLDPPKPATKQVVRVTMDFTPVGSADVLANSFKRWPVNKLWWAYDMPKQVSVEVVEVLA